MHKHLHLTQQMRPVASWSQIITFISFSPPSNHIHTAFLKHHLSAHQSPKTPGHVIPLPQHVLISLPRTVFLFNASCKIHPSPMWSFSAEVRGPLLSKIPISPHFLSVSRHIPNQSILQAISSLLELSPLALLFFLLPVPSTMSGLEQTFSKYLLNTWMNVKQKLILKMTNNYNPFSGA